MFKEWEDCVKGGVATLDCIPAIFSNLVSLFLGFAGIYALVIFILGGYKYMNSGGDAKQLEGAKGNLIYGTIGILIVLFSFLIIRVISDVTNVPCILKFGFAC